MPAGFVRAVLLTVATFASVLCCRADESTTNPSPVGVAARTFEDPDRLNWAGTAARTVRVTLWYPSEQDGTREFFDDDGERALLLRDAGVAAGGPHPLILVSHGSGGNAAQMFWLGHFLAEQGYIVVAVDHNGTDEEELKNKRPTLTDFFGWERASDLSVVLTGLLDDPAFAGKIDAARIGAAGFSLGGTTALWTAGARIDLDALRLNSPPPPPFLAEAIERRIEFSKTNPVGRESVARAGRSYRDARICAVFALAPPMGAGFTEEGLRNVDVPVCIVVGDADVVAPAESNAKHFARHIPGARLIVVPGERGHYLEPIAAEKRRAELREVAEMARRFFGEHVR
jgi:predicted dienelactone hydrolase